MAEAKVGGEGLEPRPVPDVRLAKNAVSIEVKTHFELDDARIFDLNGEGIKVTVVTEN